MRNMVIIILLGLVAACADTPEREETAQTTDKYDCPDWKITVVDDGRIYCTDPHVLEREREIY